MADFSPLHYRQGVHSLKGSRPYLNVSNSVQALNTRRVVSRMVQTPRCWLQPWLLVEAADERYRHPFGGTRPSYPSTARGGGRYSTVMIVSYCMDSTLLRDRPRSSFVSLSWMADSVQSRRRVGKTLSLRCAISGQGSSKTFNLPT